MKQLDLLSELDDAQEPIPVDPNVLEQDEEPLTGQNKLVRDILYSCGMIKTSVAREFYKINRLAARINDLKKWGMDIEGRRTDGRDYIYVWRDYVDSHGNRLT